MKGILILLSATAAAGLALPFGPNTAEPPAPVLAVSVLETFEIDPVHSTVLFRTKHIGVSSFWGRFNSLEGTIEHDASNPAKGSIRFEIDAASVDTNHESRDAHLKSPDFFSVKEFPNVTFESTGVKKKGDGLAVTGDLTLHGVTKEVVADVTHTGSGDRGERFGYRSGWEARFTIDARDFGIGLSPDSLGPEVDVIVSVEAQRK